MTSNFYLTYYLISKSLRCNASYLSFPLDFCFIYCDKPLTSYTVQMRKNDIRFSSLKLSQLKESTTKDSCPEIF